MKKNKFRGFAAILFAGVMALSGCGGGAATTDGNADTGAGDAAQYVLKVATVLADSSPNAMALYNFEDNLEEKSGGRIDVQVYAGGVLAASDEQGVEMAMSGAIEMAVDPAFALGKATNTPEYEIFDYPFIFKTREVMNEYAQTDLIQALDTKVQENYDLKLMGYYDISWLDIGNTVRPFVDPHVDGKGLKIRCAMGNIWVDTMQSLGPTAVPMAYGEVFSALQQGTLDGVLTTASNMYAGRFYEVLDYITMSDHILSVYIVMVNRPFYDSLPADLQTTLEECVDEFRADAQKLFAEDEATLADNLRAEGVEVYEFTEEDFTTWKEVVQPAVDKNVDATLGREFYEETVRLIEGIEADLGI